MRKTYIVTAKMIAHLPAVKVLAWERLPTSNIILTLDGKFFIYTHIHMYINIWTHTHHKYVWLIDIKSSQAAESVYKATVFCILQVRYSSFPVTKISIIPITYLIVKKRYRKTCFYNAACREKHAFIMLLLQKNIFSNAVFNWMSYPKRDEIHHKIKMPYLSRWKGKKCILMV